MDPSSFESSHVHEVYNEIASDFSRTRHSRWPFVETFLNSLPPASLVLDAGTGNGKYLGVRSLLRWQGKEEDLANARKGKQPRTTFPDGQDNHHDLNHHAGDSSNRVNDLYNVGYDMSDGLLGIASRKGHEVVRGDCVDMSCWRRGAFDHAISIATIHHFVTPERRTESIKQMILSILPPTPPRSAPDSSTLTSTGTTKTARAPGQILIVVWSLEQDPSLLGARSARRTTGGKKGAIEVSIDSLLAQQRRDQGREEVHPQGAECVGSSRVEGQGGDERRGKDVFVPWERQAEVVPRKKKEPTPRRGKGSRQSQAKDEGKTESVQPVGKEEHVSSSIELAPTSTTDTTIENTRTETASEAVPTPPKPSFNRYYHLFAHYELSSLVQDAAESLNLAFDCPADYPINSTYNGDVSATRIERDGVLWQGFVRLKEERWERENWVAEIETGWRSA